MAAEPRVQVRRAYDAPSADDGRRILVDRLWPRGLAKDAAHIDEWLKAVAPSSELRRWYGHDPAKFDQFRRRYAAELREPERAQALMRLKQEAGLGPVTLLTATRDASRSQAAVLAEQLRAANGTGQDEDVPGDPACWLHRVCPDCGTIADTEPPATCAQCGAEIPAG
ncbi:MAG TPA: DUF488 family protein [Streptosporangiaceae bacterium]|jgi:uncharacterized protein YeaO (DUF488 family)